MTYQPLSPVTTLPAATDIEREQSRTVRREVRIVELTITMITVGMITIFKVVQLDSLPILPRLDATWSRFFIELALYIYFLAWILGCRSDLAAQESVTRDLTHVSSRRPMLFVSAGLLVAAFTALWFADSFVALIAAFSAFLAIDVVASRIYYAKLERQFDSSREVARARDNPWAVHEVDVVQRFTTGPWRKRRAWIRFGALALLLALHLIGLGEIVAARAPVLTGASVEGLWILIYVVAFELWIWIWRVRRDGKLTLLRELAAEPRRSDSLALGPHRARQREEQGSASS